MDTANAIAQDRSTEQTLRLVAFALNVVSCVGFGLLLIPLAWMIPMTIHSWKIYKGEEPNTLTFGICDLLFVNMISGVLLLITEKEA